MVRIELTLEDERNFQPGRRLILSSTTGEREVEVEFFRRQHGRCVLKIRGIDAIDDAERIVGSEIRMAAGELLPPGDGAFYTFQLKGCAVYEKGDCLGTITDVLDLGGSEILKVDRDGVETLIPFARSYLKAIDLAAKRIDVDLPEGLRELNK